MTKLNKFVRRYTSIAATIDILRRKELPLLDPQTWDDRNDRYFMARYKERKELGGLYGLCAATCSETYHHWRIFTEVAGGACIEIKRDALENALGEIEGVRFGNIEYLLLAQVEQLSTQDLQRLPFVKRFAFQPEEEYRIIAETVEAQCPAISIDFPVSLINKVYLNPWLPKSVAESLTLTLREIPGCKRLPISKSHLIDNGRWKTAGDKIVGKKQSKLFKLGKTSKPGNR
jgi:hypothetical protein